MKRSTVDHFYTKKQDLPKKQFPETPPCFVLGKIGEPKLCSEFILQKFSLFIFGLFVWGPPSPPSFHLE